MQIVDVFCERDAFADGQISRRRVARVFQHLVHGVEKAGQRAAQVAMLSESSLSNVSMSR